VRPYGSFAVVVFIVMIFVSCAYSVGMCRRKITTNIFFDKFTIQNYKKEIKEDVLFAVYVNLWVTFCLFAALTAVLRLP